MRWEDERYVRLYTRDTATWIAIGPEGRHTLMGLLRKVDRAGVLDVIDGEENEIVAALLMDSVDEVRVGLKRLCERGVVVLGQNQLRMPHFREAQECRTSDKERQRKSRELASLGHTPSHAVTASHTPSQMSPLAVPSRTVPSRAEKLAGKKPPADPRLAPLTDWLVDVYAQERGGKYKHGGAKDALALKALLPIATDAEISDRWRLGLRATGWASCSTFAQLGSKWNDLAAPAKASGPVDAGTQAHTQTGYFE